MSGLRVTAALWIDERDIEETFIHAGGPGGQNVNKVATAVQLRFDLAHAAGLDEATRARLARLAGRRLSRDGVLVITAQRFRSLERNRQDARERLVELVRRAGEAPVPRRKSRPTLASKRRRLEEKARRSGIKRLRRSGGEE